MSQSTEAPVNSQTKSDQSEPIDCSNVCVNSDVVVENNKTGMCSPEIFSNNLLDPPNGVLSNYSEAELDINCALVAEQENYATSEAQLICCNLTHNSDNTVKLARRTCVKKTS